MRSTGGNCKGTQFFFANASQHQVATCFCLNSFPWDVMELSFYSTWLQIHFLAYRYPKPVSWGKASPFWSYEGKMILKMIFNHQKNFARHFFIFIKRKRNLASFQKYNCRSGWRCCCRFATPSDKQTLDSLYLFCGTFPVLGHLYFAIKNT